MGRYAYFNTGFEYKFEFGIQSSMDIELFGGEDISDYSNEYIKPSREWIDEDKEIIIKKLEYLIKPYGYELPNFESFKKDINGTYKLGYYLDLAYKTFQSSDSFFTFRLGCLIYHQLLYTDVLTAVYEY